MKKIKSDLRNNKDRILCISKAEGTQDFYYQMKETHDYIWIMQTKFSGSVFAYFRTHGRYEGNGHSLTVKQLYELKNHRNIKLSRIFERLPSLIDYTLEEKLFEYNEKNMPKKEAAHLLPEKLSA